MLGASANIHVLTTYIFQLTVWTPPLYNTAAAVSIILMAVTGILVFLQHLTLSSRSYTTVAGNAFRPRSLNLGPWRWVTLALAIIYLFVVVALPTFALIVAAFRKFMFIRDIPALFDLKQYTLVHFESIFDNPLTVRSIWNTMKVGVVTAAYLQTLHVDETIRPDVKREVLEEGVSKGKGISVPLRESGVFPAIFNQMVTVGEQAGRLEDTFLLIADRFEADTRNLIKRFVSLFEPVLILLMGLVVGLIVISMLMGIFRINEIPI